MNSVCCTFFQTVEISVNHKRALGFLFFPNEVLMTHLGDAAHQVDKLTEIHAVALVCVQVFEDVVDCCLVICFLHPKTKC